jgi:hypothetical protein
VSRVTVAEEFRGEERIKPVCRLHLELGAEPGELESSVVSDQLKFGLA